MARLGCLCVLSLLVLAAPAHAAALTVAVKGPTRHATVTVRRLAARGAGTPIRIPLRGRSRARVEGLASGRYAVSVAGRGLVGDGRLARAGQTVALRVARLRTGRSATVSFTPGLPARVSLTTGGETFTLALGPDAYPAARVVRLREVLGLVPRMPAVTIDPAPGRGATVALSGGGTGAVGYDAATGLWRPLPGDGVAAATQGGTGSSVGAADVPADGTVVGDAAGAPPDSFSADRELEIALGDALAEISAAKQCQLFGCAAEDADSTSADTKARVRDAAHKLMRLACQGGAADRAAVIRAFAATQAAQGMGADDDDALSALSDAMLRRCEAAFRAHGAKACAAGAQHQDGALRADGRHEYLDYAWRLGALAGDEAGQDATVAEIHKCTGYDADDIEGASAAGDPITLSAYTCGETVAGQWSMNGGSGRFANGFVALLDYDSTFAVPSAGAAFPWRADVPLGGYLLTAMTGETAGDAGTMTLHATGLDTTDAEGWHDTWSGTGAIVPGTDETLCPAGYGR